MESLSTPFLDHVAVVTGVAGAIGQAIATRLVAGWARLVLVGRTRDSLEKLASSWKLPDTRVHLCPADLADDAQLEQLGLDIKRRYGSVDVLVHCAGTIALDPIQSGKIEDFRSAVTR